MTHVHRQVDTILTLYVSSDKYSILQSMQVFSKYCTHTRVYTSVCKIMLYFRYIIVDIHSVADELYTLLHAHTIDTNNRLKHMFVDCIVERDASKYSSFKDNLLYYIKRQSAATRFKHEVDVMNLLNILELLFDINFGIDIADSLNKFKEYMPELEVGTVYLLCLKLLKAAHGFRISSMDVINERLKESFNAMGEITVSSPINFEQLWTLVYSSDTSLKLSALNYFLQIKRNITSFDDDRFKYHVLYIDKRVKFLRNQSLFLEKFSKLTGSKKFELGLILIKRIFMSNLRTNKSDISLLVSALASKLIRDNTSNKALSLYACIVDYIVNEDSTMLGSYYLDEHDEPMMKILANCKYTSSTSDIVNLILQHLISNGYERLASILYFYYVMIGYVQRHNITMHEVLEQVINDWVNIKPEFMEFIELYIDREASTLVDQIIKIQSRIIFNMRSEKEIQKAGSLLESIMAKEFYEIVYSILTGDQPSLSYLSELFKIPFTTMKFVYILTQLKLDTKPDYSFDQLLSNSDMSTILTDRNIKSQELVFLLKICLNKIDYDSITDLLRLMKLDQSIFPDILINLLLLDLEVDRKPISLRQFNKKFIIHSSIFTRIGVSKELCWAFCRVLKGDFLIFFELLDLLSENLMPQNHKYFNNLVTGLIGVKNYVHSNPKTFKSIASSGLRGYCSVLNDTFMMYSRQERENSLEYAQYLLHNCQGGFRLHPCWHAMTQICSDRAAYARQTKEEPGPKRIPLLEGAKLHHLLVIDNIVNMDESILEFVYDFAFFRHISKFLNNFGLQPYLSSEWHERVVDMQQFFAEQVSEYKKIMVGLMKDKKIQFDYQHFSNKGDSLYRSVLVSLCRGNNELDVTLDFDHSQFYSNLNIETFIAWRNDLKERREKSSTSDSEKKWISNLMQKIDEMLNQNQKFVDPFSMFVTPENTTSKEYWERTFDEVDYLTDYLNSLVDLFMDSLDEVEDILDKYQLNQDADIKDYTPDVNANHQKEDLPSNNDNDISMDSNSAYASSMGERARDNLSNKNKSPEDTLSIRWTGLPIYVLLERLRIYQSQSADEKAEKILEIVYKSNMLFGIVEKTLFFVGAGESFRKYMYFSQFNLSMGLRMPTKSWVKFAGSLQMPELFQYYQSLINGLSPQANNPTMDYIVKCWLIKNVFENDRDNFSNRGIFAQFCYNNSVNARQIENERINLGMAKMDYLEIASLRKLKTREDDADLARDYYTLQFIASDQFADVAGPQRTKKMEVMIATKGPHEERIKDPTILSVNLINNGFYEFNDSNFISREENERLLEIYFSYKQGKERTVDLIHPKSIPYKIDAMDLKFLNDLALGKYTVISDTKNIFTENFELATYQKIYESILHLHSARRNFDSCILYDSLQSLSPYLSSNIRSLHSILEFVVEPIDSIEHSKSVTSIDADPYKVYRVFQDLSLKHQSFIHLFLLHTYSKDTRVY